MWNALGESVGAQAISLRAEPEASAGREFLTSAGFGGVAALTAALIVAVVLWVLARNARAQHALGLEQRDEHHAALRADQQRSAALQRAWQRLQWVVDTAGIEPASSSGVTLGLGPELASEILRGIVREADELGDEALGNAATVHLSQLSLVLAQQAGPLTPSTPAAKPAASPASSSTPAATTAAAKVDKPDAATADGEQATTSTARTRRRS